MLEIKKINKCFNEKIIFSDFSLVLASSNLYLLEGENGKGKTTLFRIVSGIDIEYDGKIFFNNKKLNHKDVFYYNIDFNLYDILTVKENLKVISKNYLPLIRKLNLEYLLNKKVNELSKGEKARIGIVNKKVNELSKGEKARIGIVKAILLNKPILLLDEPFSYLDLENSKLIFELIEEYSKDHLVILINHKYVELNDEIKNKINLDKDCVFKEGQVLNKDKINKPNSFFLSFKIFIKNIWRNLIGLLLSFISCSLLLFSFDTFFTNKQAIFNEGLDKFNVEFLDAKLKSREEEYQYYDIYEKEGLILTSKIDIKVSENHFDLASPYLIIGNSYTLNDITYYADKNNPTIYVSENKYKNLGLSENQTTIGILLDGYYKDYQTFNVTSVKGISDTYSFLFLSDLSTPEGYLTIKNTIGLGSFINKINADLSIYSNNNILLTNEEFNEEVIVDNNKENLQENEVNLVIDSYIYEQVNDFDGYFNANLLNKEFVVENNSTNFSLKSYLETIKVVGYNVVNQGSVINFDLGFELSNEIWTNLNNYSYLDSPISNPYYSFIIDVNKAKDSKLYERQMTLMKFYTSGDIVDANYIDNLFQYNKVIAPIVLATGILFTGLFIFLLISLFKTIFNLNKENIYVMKKDGLNEFNITNVLLLPAGISTLITYLISIGTIYGINNYLNNVFFIKFASTDVKFNYYSFNLVSFVISFLILTIIFVAFYIYIYKKLKKLNFIEIK